MSYLEFDKQALVNLEYSLSRETIRTNRGGSFACSTIVGCNTRKYHGLLICPLEDGKRHVLLSSLDVSVIQQGTEFQLGIHKFPGGLFMPKGHMYVRDFDTEPIPKLTYRIGDTVLSREILLVEEEEKILARFTLHDSQDPIRLKMTPFLAFREIHKLNKATMEVNSDYETIEGGIKTRLYENYPYLYLQCSKASEFIPAPDWYYNIEYIEEQKRGYDYQEDLFVNGYFEVNLKKGESFIFSAGLQETPPKSLKKLYDSEIKKRIPRDGYENCLLNSAQQFLVRNDDKTDLIAGYPWFGQWARDTFIALPGLTIAIGDIKSCKSVLDTMSENLHGPLFYNIDTTHSKVNHHSVDAPLWYCWAIQKYAEATGKPAKLWEIYGNKIKTILYGYRNGTDFNIHMTETGLIYAGVEGEALTWMDSVIDDKPVTPRIGMPVEINALWYNAVEFGLELARAAKDKDFIAEWEQLPEKIRASFVKMFWSPQKRYLADCIRGEYVDWSVRPNQVFAASLPYSPLDNDMKRSVLNVIESDLLTPKGLRTLSPKHPDYRGIYGGSPEDRDLAYHQGTVWPWLLGHFSEAYLKLYKQSALDKVKAWFHNFEDDMRVHGIGSISEIYDGNPPYRPNGAISQAWSVAEVLRIRYMIQKMEENTK